MPLILFLILLWSGIAAAQEPSDVVVNQHRDWLSLCGTVAGNARCEIQQTLSVGEEGSEQPVMQTTISLTREGGPLMELILPLGVHVSEGVVFQVDEGERMRVPYQLCTPEGCIVLLRLDEELLTMMRAGNNMRVGFWVFGDEDLKVAPISLMGFTAAMATLR